MNILFVCTANVSRSFLAEKLLIHEIGPLKGVSVSSAGLYAFPGSPPDPVIVAYLQEKGIPEESHPSRQVRTEDIGWADMILVMEKDQAADLEKRWPGAKGKVKLLGSYIAGVLEGDDILDPYGKSPYYYRLAQSQITLAIKALAKTLTQGRNVAKDSRRRTRPRRGERGRDSR
jgi:protein-tyrosine phosphatase